MKYLFIIVFAGLLAASFFTWRSQPEVQTELPVIYWVTDANPARAEQVRIFHEWLKKNDYPQMELRLDSANRNPQKMVIQGVSGVGGDVMDIGSGGGLRYFHAMGLLEDVTEAGKRLGFDPSKTWKAVYPEITLHGRQYMFPCNVTAHLLWVNKGTFRKYNQPIPPRTWDLETFERMGKAFVDAANPPGERRKVFYVANLDVNGIRRSMGLSIFNESLTRCILNDPRQVKTLRLMLKWTYEDHILPSAADRESFDTESGYAGPILQLFNTGNYAMFRMGRYALIQLREFEGLDLGVSYPPCEEFLNTWTGTRAGAVYAGSKKKELAEYFLAYLASEDYNMQIVRDADALPPNPAFTKSEEFIRPPDYPNEHGIHEVFAEAADRAAISSTYCPFVLDSVAKRIINQEEAIVMAHRQSPEEAAARIEERVNEEIQRNLREDPKLQPLYDELVERQKKIDALRAEGKPVPLSWIENPFLRRYYAFKGWGREL